MLDSTIRTDFPLLQDDTLAYLDTAATSQTPGAVIEATQAYYTNFRANTHRGLYKISEEATARYEKARADVARFVGAQPDEIVFTPGATASSNMLVYALEATLDLSPGDEIVTTVMEHHASLVPLQQLAKRRRLHLRHIPLSGFDLAYADADTLISPKTKLVAVTLASNVLGTITDVARLAKRAHAVGALMVVDATAAVGHIPVDVKKLDVDFLYFSGHKMCGPTGIGVLYGKKENLETLEPSFFGGGMVDDVTQDKAVWTSIPTRFEAGTQNIAGAIGLGTAVAYLENISIETIHTHVQELLAYAYKTLTGINDVHVFCEKDHRKNTGIISFTLDGIHAHDVAQIAARDNVAIRAGHHCAMPLHGTLGVPATARASIYLYNTKQDIDRLVTSIKKAQDMFNG